MKTYDITLYKIQNVVNIYFSLDYLHPQGWLRLNIKGKMIDKKSNKHQVMKNESFYGDWSTKHI